MLWGLWSLPLLWILHEGGHWLTCYLLTKKKIHFNWHFEFKIIPVGNWMMPCTIKDWQKKIIYFAGFGLEFAVMPWMPPVYRILAVIHFITYPFRYGDTGEGRFWRKLLTFGRWSK